MTRFLTINQNVAVYCVWPCHRVLVIFIVVVVVGKEADDEDGRCVVDELWDERSRVKMNRRSNTQYDGLWDGSCRHQRNLTSFNSHTLF